MKGVSLGQCHVGGKVTAYSKGGRTLASTHGRALIQTICSPVLPALLITVADRAAPWVDWKLETLLHLGLDKQRGTLVALVGVLLEDSSVVLLRVLTALYHNGKELSELAVGVVGVIHMGRGLSLC